MNPSTTLLREDLSRFMARAAAGFLETGFHLFHTGKADAYGRLQAAIGNLCVGTELSVKAEITRVDPALVFKDLPIEARAWLSSDRANGYNSRPVELDLRDFAFEPHSFEEVVRAFYVLYPTESRLLRPYFKQTAELKEMSLRASLGVIKPEEPLRAAYLAYKVSELLSKKIEGYTPVDADHTFAKRYETERANRVQARLNVAREKAKALKVDIAYNDPMPPDGWDALEARCPVCKNWAVLSGHTEIRCEKSAGREEEFLDFYAYALDCDACGLRLDDTEELKLADLGTRFDRSEDLPKWRDDKHV